MDIWQRRAILEPIENPDRNIDFVSSLTGGLSALGGRMRVTLRYVPDAKTLRPARFTA